MAMTSPLCPFYLRDCGSAAPYAPSVAELNIGTLQIAFRKQFSRIKTPDLRLSDSGGVAPSAATMKLTRSSAWKNMAELELYSTHPYQDKAYSRLELFFVYGWRLAHAWG